MSTKKDEHRAGGVAGAALRLAGSRRTAGVVMALGIVGALSGAVIALFFTSSGVAVGVFVGTLLFSCLAACLVAWLFGERAARELTHQAEELAHRRSTTHAAETDAS